MTEESPHGWNAFCFTCKKNLVVQNEGDKCSTCGSKVKIMGRKLSLTTSNGPYASHT